MEKIRHTYLSKLKLFYYIFSLLLYFYRTLRFLWFGYINTYDFFLWFGYIYKCVCVFKIYSYFKTKNKIFLQCFNIFNTVWIIYTVSVVVVLIRGLIRSSSCHVITATWLTQEYTGKVLQWENVLHWPLGLQKTAPMFGNEQDHRECGLQIGWKRDMRQHITQRH